MALTNPNSTFIYALVNPRNNHVRYIGKANDPNKRLKEHLRLMGKNPWFNRWLSQLIDIDIKPIIRLIMEIPKSEWGKWEKHWITSFRWAGEKITNLHDGGTGGNTMSGRKHSLKTRQKMSKMAFENRENRVKAGRARKNTTPWLKGKTAKTDKRIR